ncbi:MAG: translation elongation factor Ts [Chloroflexota bacterium]
MSEPISANAVKELRDRSGAGIMECKRALEDSGGNVEKALIVLRDQGFAKAEKRSDRATSQGMVDCYIHGGGRIGALVEVNCETDFVGRTEDFKALAHDLAMQVAATNPRYLSAEDVPADEEGDPKEICLLEQAFIKNAGLSIRDLINATVSKTGEVVRVRRFARFELGGE